MALLTLAIYLPILAVALLAVYLMMGWGGVVTALLAGAAMKLCERLRNPPSA